MRGIIVIFFSFLSFQILHLTITIWRSQSGMILNYHDFPKITENPYKSLQMLNHGNLVQMKFKFDIPLEHTKMTYSRHKRISPSPIPEKIQLHQKSARDHS